MRLRHFASIITASIALMAVSTVPLMAQDTVDDPNKIDKVTLKSGQALVGEIIDESDDTITIKVMIAGISAVKILNKSDISVVRRDAVDRPTSGSRSSASIGSMSGTPSKEGRPNPDDPRPVVYKIPFKGLVGYDTTKRLTMKLWEEAIDVGADHVVFEFECYDGFYSLQDQMDLFEEIKRQAIEHDIQLIAWVNGEVRGAAVAMVLMFPDIVFHPQGWMGDGRLIDELLKQMWEDKQVQAKMIAAWVGHCRGMANDGGHDPKLCEAMIRPEPTLYVRMEGEDPVFYLDPNSETIAKQGLMPVDTSTNDAIRLDANMAKLYGVAPQTARDLKSLMRIRDVREYIYYEGKSTDQTENWTEFRDRSWDDIDNHMADVQAAPEHFDTARQILSNQLQHWRKVRSILKRCPPHTVPPFGEIQDGTRYGKMPMYFVEEQISLLQRQIQDLNNGPGGGGGGGRRGPGSGGGGGGGGGG